MRWRGENDKRRYEHSTPLTPVAVAALAEARQARAAIGEAWVFPSPVNPRRPISPRPVETWWQRAETLAGLKPTPGRGWHSVRRQFATELKHTPLKDLCALGGWKDYQTLLTCYQHPDALTMRAALEQRMRLQG